MDVISFPMLTGFDPKTGKVEGIKAVERRLSELRGVFADEAACQDRISRDHPVIYSVSSAEPAHGDGQLHYGIGALARGALAMNIS